MTEITQADRDAAISGYFAWCSGNPVIPNKIASGVMDDHSMVKAFARHREAAAAEERAKIVAWLRGQGEFGSEHAQAWGETFAEQIEAKEHLK